MGLFGAFTDFLSGSVGNNLDNKPKDIRNTKENLSTLGFFDDETDNDFITKELDNGVKSFQKEKGLKIDGRLFPSGETEREIFKTLEKRNPDEVFGKADDNNGGSIGFGGNVSGTFEPFNKPNSMQSPFVLNVKSERQETEIPIPESKPNTAQEIPPIPKKKPEFDATGRRVRDDTPPVPERKPIVPELSRPSFDLKKAPVVNIEKDRIDSLLNNTPAKFDIKFKKTDKILKEAAIDTFIRDNDIARKTLEQHSEVVEKFSKKHSVDPDLVKAIMWDENARGDKFGTNRLFNPVSSSQRPMNIKGSLWSGLIGKQSARLDNPEENIEAGVILIKRISDRIEKPTPGKVASIWQFTGRENTNEFGNDVDIIYNQKPWKRKK